MWSADGDEDDAMQEWYTAEPEKFLVAVTHSVEQDALGLMSHMSEMGGGYV
jgi:hypothetical protein